MNSYLKENAKFLSRKLESFLLNFKVLNRHSLSPLPRVHCKVDIILLLFIKGASVKTKLSLKENLWI